MNAHIESIAGGYIKAALWADCMPLPPACECEADRGDDRERPHFESCPARGWDGGESGGMYGRLEPTAESSAYVLAMVTAFVEAAGDDLDTFAEFRAYNPDDGDVWEHVGHDLRLTSGGHGTGFWDRSYDGPGDYSTSNPDAVAFSAAQRRLSDLATDARFTRIGGGDVWQFDDDTAEFDPLPFHAGAAPGERWAIPT